MSNARGSLNNLVGCTATGMVFDRNVSSLALKPQVGSTEALGVSPSAVHKQRPSTLLANAL